MFHKESKNIFYVTGNDPQTSIHYSRTEYFKRFGSVKYTKTQGWQKLSQSIVPDDALEALRNKYPNGPPYGRNSFSIEI